MGLSPERLCQHDKTVVLAIISGHNFLVEYASDKIFLAGGFVIREIRNNFEQLADELTPFCDDLKEELGIDRVTVMLYQEDDNVLQSVAASGVPNIDHHNIRAPVVELPGISSRAVEARSYLENRSIVIRDRNPDPQYRMRDKTPHKDYSREFAVFPLSNPDRKLGILAVSVDHGNDVGLTETITNEIESRCDAIVEAVERVIPEPPGDRELIDAVRETVNENMISTAAQPIVDDRNDKIHGHELLLRVDHPLFSGPGELLETATSYNYLRDVSFQVHRQAVDKISDLPDDQYLFINLHPKDFVEYEDIDDPANPFHDVDLSRVVFEVTERYYLRPNDRIHSSIGFFKEMGVKIALDDLGSGFSNLEVLADLCPDYIKLDLSLIRGIHRNDQKRKLIDSLLTYCHEVGSTCVAEGIETAEEYEILSDLNCSLMQGYYFARPDSSLSSWSEIQTPDTNT